MISKRLLVILYAGDYRDAYYNIKYKSGETYYAQNYVINILEEINRSIDQVTILCTKAKENYNQKLPNGIRVIGIKKRRFNFFEVTKAINSVNPTHIVIRFPSITLFLYAIYRKYRTIGILADSFLQKGIIKRTKHYLLARILNKKEIEYICNHGLNACLSLNNIGVKSNKIIPWDWPHIWDHSLQNKKLDINKEKYSLIFVGSVAKEKGVADIIKAARILDRSFLSFNILIVGSGKINFFKNKVKKFNIEKTIEFLGPIPNSRVIELMKKSDIVIIPSKDIYPEGLPLTIYESLKTRTPIIASNHPMFKGILINKKNAIIYKSGDYQLLACYIMQLLSNIELYSRISNNSFSAWQKIQISAKWGDVIKNWIKDSKDGKQWFSQINLGSHL